jgi:hypothetical protein
MNAFTLQWKPMAKGADVAAIKDLMTNIRATTHSLLHVVMAPN